MPIRAVIFDMGGVILRTENQGGRRSWEARLGLKEGELSRNVFDSAVAARATIGKVPESAIWEHVAATLGLNDGQLEEFQRDFWSGDRVDETLMQFIRDLRPRYKTAILSNAWLSARRAITEKFGLSNAFDTIIISAEEGVAKPDARIYRIAVERLNVQPHKAVFVDDMLENAQAARDVGMYAVQFKNTPQAIRDVKQILGE